MSLSNAAKNPLIIALDVDSAERALRLVENIGTAADFYKVGMELYAAAGMEVVKKLATMKRVFLDLKLYDIGETVKRAVRTICQADITFLTVHGSRSIMQAAVEGRGTSPVKLLAVTVLTSFDQEDLLDLGFPTSVAGLVELRVKKAMESGMDGIVCSPREVGCVRQLTGPHLQLITPGVRSAGAAKGDQKRISTPREAIENGADFIVIGRQVTRAEDPRAACEQILAEIQSTK